RFGGSFYLIVNFSYCTANHCFAGDIIAGAEYVLRGIVRIDVSGNKISRHIPFYDMRDEYIRPRSLCGGRSTYTNLLTDCLQCFGRMIVKLEVSLLLGIAGPKINIRFIPYFEVPFADFVRTIAIDQMLRKSRD